MQPADEDTIKALQGQLAAAQARIRQLEARHGSPPQAAASFYDKLTADTPDFIMRYRPDGTRTFVNQAYADYLGRTVEDMVGSRDLPDFHPDDIAMALARVANLTPDRPVTRHVMRLRMPDGTIRWHQWIDRAIFDEAGQPVEYQSIGRDITEQKEAQDALRRSEALFRGLFEYSYDGIKLVDEDGCLVEWNAAISDISGIAREEALGQTLWEVQARFLPDDADKERTVARLRELGQKIVGGEHEGLRQTGRAFRIKRPDGQQRVLQEIVFPIETPEGRVVGGITRDITEKWQTEETYRALVDNLPVGLLLFQDLKLVYANPAYLALSGYPAEELVGCHVDELLFTIHPEDRERILAEMKATRHADGHFGPAEFEARVQRPDGQVSWVRIQGFEVSYLGRPAYLVMHLDISAEKKAEQRQRALLREQERVAVLQAFVRDASHDLRTPLSTIINNLYILRQMAGGDAGQERLLLALDNQVSHLQRLLDDLLHMARLDLHSELEVAPVTVATLVDEVATRHQAMARERAVTLVVRPPVGSCTVHGDAFYLERALAILVTNALQFTPAGGQVAVGVSCRATELHIEVTDTGEGIAPEDLPHIFERFYRGDRSRRMERGGTGLGLSIARKVVEVHQGRIEVVTAPGQGSTFRVILPCLAPNP
jgi:PAS domain S-box-containing protein